MPRKQERKPKAKTGTPANTLRINLDHNQVKQNVSSESIGLISVFRTRPHMEQHIVQVMQ